MSRHDAPVAGDDGPTGAQGATVPAPLGRAWIRGTRVETSLSAFGAGFVGLGAGLLLGRSMPTLGWILLLGGLVTHGAGMIALHGRFRGQERPGLGWWLEGAYWVCWIVLAAVLAFLVWLTLT